jgi:hypothetical protein
MLRTRLLQQPVQLRRPKYLFDDRLRQAKAAAFACNSPPQSPRPSDLGFFLFLLPLYQPMSQRMFLGNKIASIRGPAHPFKDIP